MPTYGAKDQSANPLINRLISSIHVPKPFTDFSTVSYSEQKDLYGRMLCMYCVDHRKEGLCYLNMYLKSLRLPD